MRKKQPKNVGINPIGYRFQIMEKEEAEKALKLAKSQKKPVKFLKKQKI
jgi:hypothetical protein